MSTPPTPQPRPSKASSINPSALSPRNTSSRPDRQQPPSHRSNARARPTPIPSPQNPAKSIPKDKSLIQSYLSLPPNTRIAFGLVLGVVGFAGLMWDRRVAQDEPTPQETGNLISIRTVDRDNK